MTDQLTDHRPRVFFIEQAAVEEYNLTPHEGWLYVVILSHANKHTREGFPGLTRLAKLANMSRRQVINCIQSLESKQLIRVERTTSETPAGKKQREVNHYFINQATKPESKNWVDAPSAHTAPPSASDSLPLVHDVHNNNIDSNNKEPADTSAAPPITMVKDKPQRRRKPARKPKSYDDVDAKAIDAVIAAYIAALDKHHGKPLRNFYQEDNARESAAKLIRAGHVPDEVERFMAAQYKSAFWRGKQIGWTYILDNLPGWAKFNRPKPPAGTNMDDFSKWRLEEMSEEQRDAS